MAIPSFNGFELNTTTYIPESIEFRTRAPRHIESEVIARRMGKKLINTQIYEKVIQISGTILAGSPALLQAAVDELYKNTTAVEGTLIIESGRSWLATVERLNIPDRRYNQTITNFEMQFVCVRPYAEGSLQTAVFIIPSGQNSKTITTTISGSAPNRPLFRFVLPSGSGAIPVKLVSIQYSDTGNQVTLSGAYTAGNSLTFNYDRYIATQEGVNKDFTGQMEDIAAGSATFVITVSGVNNGTRVSLEYNPRYW